MRARTVVTGVLGILVGSGAVAEDAPVDVQTFPAPHAAGALQMGLLGTEIWFAQPNGNSLARVNPDGTLTERLVPVGGSGPLAISRFETADGRILFTEVGTNRIGVLAPNGSVTEYGIPTPDSNPRGVAAGPALVWFTEYDGNRIGRLDLGSGSITEFPVPTFASGPLGIALGPGATSDEMWFVQNLSNKIGRVDQNGAFSEFFIPTTDSGPTAIVRGFDGSDDVMYFTEARGNRIGKSTRTGVITERPIPTPNSGPSDLVFDSRPPGGVWFTERTSGRIGWMSVASRFREFQLPGGSKPESLALSEGTGYFGPASVWYVDGTKRVVGRLSDNHLFAIGVGNSPTLDTEIEITNATDESVKVRLGWPPDVCTICTPTYLDLTLPRHETVETTASAIPSTESRFLVISGIEPEISDVPETEAWVIDAARPDVRVRLPLVSYWQIAERQPPSAQGRPKPVLEFPARRQNRVRTSLILGGIEAGESFGVPLEIEAVSESGEVVGRMEADVIPGEALVLSRILSDLGIFENFDGHLRVTRLSRAGYFWGVVEIYENDILTRLMPPGSELDEPQPCTDRPSKCRQRTTRVVTRDEP
jgi:virginiamycin B lyase